MTPAISVANEPAFPAGCPKCGEPAGLPYIATTSCNDERIRVGLRCGKCAHEWRFKMPLHMPVVKRKLDRRVISRGN